MYATTASSDDSVEKYGWTSVPHDQSVLLQGVSPWDPADYTIAQMPFSESEGELTSKVASYAVKHLPEQVYNHSMRVYFYGQPPRTPRDSLKKKLKAIGDRQTRM
jgi:cyanamide hydratase